MSKAGEATADSRYQTLTRITLLAILTLALSLRLVYVFQIRSSPYFDHPTMDAQYHTDWATSLAAGETFQKGPFFRAPLYPLFLSLCFSIFGIDFLIPRIVQCLFGTSVTFLCYLIGREAFDRSTGLLAALFAATYWVLIYFDGELLIETLALPLSLLALLLSLRLRTGLSAGQSALAGAAWGVSFIVRPNALIFMPLLAGWLFVQNRSSLKIGLRRAAAFLLGVLIPILPVTAYNYFVGKDVVLISSQAGVNFWIGNNPDSDGGTAIVPGTRPDWWGGYYDSISQAEAAAGRPLKASEVSQYYTRKAWGFILGQPARSLKLFAWKFRLFWTDWEVGNDLPIRFFAYRFGPVTRWLPLGFAFIAPLGILGMILNRRNGKDLFPLWGFILVYMCSVLLFFVNARFRLPVIPVLLVYAAAALTHMATMLRSRRFKALAFGVVALVVMVLLIRRIPARLDTSDAAGYQALAAHERRSGNDAAAVKLLEQALALRPQFFIARRQLGGSLAKLGQLPEAEGQLREVLRQNPGDAYALSDLAEVFLLQGRIPESEKAALESVQAAPSLAKAYFILGMAYQAAGKGRMAEYALRTAATLGYRP